ncbi:MAG: transcription antitermination factor NusB [Acidobacteriota bacterium]|nr:transcription antitermination factor NusB [Acidobacteriota bacterium]
MTTIAGKRRTAREMAVQMLYQRDVGGSDLAQIFRTFDLNSLLIQDEPEGDAPGADGAAATAPDPAPVRSASRTKAREQNQDGGVSVATRGPATGSVTTEGRDQVRRRRGQLEESFEYARTLVNGVVENRQRIDELISEQADNWRLERMPVVDRNVLRLAVYELLYELDIPKLVVVDEAIELAKRFGSENSGRFVNGLLDGLLRRHTFPGRMS